MRKTILGLAAAAAITIPLVGTAAHASVTVDEAGKGFVGKGKVQTAFGWNNATTQKNQTGVTFSAEQPTTQSLSQDVSQTGVEHNFQMGVQSATQCGTQSGIQVVSQDLTCEFTNGSGTKVFHRDGVRDGDRTGTREGTKTATATASVTACATAPAPASRSGKQVGKVASALAATDKKTGQYTGWFLNGFTGTRFTPTSATRSGTPRPSAGTPSASARLRLGYTFGDSAFAGDYSFGDYTFEPVTGTEWGEWDALPGENPDDCLRSQNADHITQISNVITPGAITDGAVTDGAIVGGDVTDGPSPRSTIADGAITLIDPVRFGAVVNDGAAKVFATFGGVTKGL